MLVSHPISAGWLPALVSCVLFAGCSSVAPRPEPEREANASLPADPNALVLGAEMALERGQYQEAAKAYAAAAAASDDETLSEQATRMAYQHAQLSYVAQSADRWLAINATSEEARRFAAFAALRLYRIEAAAEHFTALLKTAFINPSAGFLALMPQLMEEGSRPAATATLQRLVQTFPDIAESHYALAQAALQSDNNALALSEAARAAEIAPYWPPAGLLLARAQLASGLADDSLATAKRVLEQDSRPANRLEYAVLLLSAGQDDQGRIELAELLAGESEAAGAERALALIEFQMNNFDAAARRFNRLLTSGKYVYESLFYLGAISERRGAHDDALQLYSRVLGGEYALAAQSRIGQIKLQTGALDDGLAAMQEFGEAHPELKIDLINARANLLAEAGDDVGALALLDQALEIYPDEQLLRFARAFQLDRMKRHKAAVAAMEELVEDRPGDPTALNALGYTLVDRTRRHREGFELIQQAFAQTPDSGAVLDSMGWALFKLGRHEEALGYLERAAERIQEPDVDLHLGDVLWALKRPEDARKAWELGIERDPENEELLKRIKRFKSP